MQSISDFVNCRRSVSLIIGMLNRQNSEFAKNMKCSLVQRISERRNVSFVGFMQYLNFGRKYDAAPVIVDLSRLPNRNSLIQQAKIIMIRLFCELNELLSISSHTEEKCTETLEEKYLMLYEKLEKVIHSKAKALRCSTSKSSSLSKIMKQELQLFDSTEHRSSNIIKLGEALKRKQYPQHQLKLRGHFLLPGCS
ncbi:hypothetical protein AVEN_145142-1 [Araneus ventricosus]|uniref:Uncharacterized protein n=1 Tax=Araneus ventricosus TaxID=182803 RepID=A0A4Y2TI85_ARAVE|nr:hypothetical protein AVEN_103417-1 [Araneus ventricosus]GBN99185.1 hypothetical protein AVEN_137921-1 [Araneus ventricosus]GBN99274.1 hypothetical protein AVEN_63559-1 [Araneus ventricosus]GBN99276.1 hypothetical protein AVEN_145142-1 [Araneus ventricosus]